MEKVIETLANTLGIPLTAVIVTAVGMVGVYVFLSRKVKATKTETDKNQTDTNEKLAVLAQRVFTCEKRLDEGNARFDAMDSTLRSINNSLERLTGMFEMFLRSKGVER